MDMRDPNFSFEANREHKKGLKRFQDERRAVAQAIADRPSKPKWKNSDKNAAEKPLWQIVKRAKDGTITAMKFTGPAKDICGKHGGRRFRLEITDACAIAGHHVEPGCELRDLSANEAFQLHGLRGEIVEEYPDAQ